MSNPDATRPGLVAARPPSVWVARMTAGRPRAAAQVAATLDALPTGVPAVVSAVGAPAAAPARAQWGAARGVLFPDDLVVLDEAHTIPEVATDHFGLRLSSYGTERMLKYLFNPKNRRGLLAKHGGPMDQQLVIDALEASEQFFGFLREKLLDKHPIVRIRTESAAEPWLDEPLQKLIKAIGARADKLDEGPARDELLEQRGRLKTYQTGLRQWLGVADEGSVYWLERSGRRQQIVTLRTAPLDIAPHIRDHLLERGTSVLFTSATLAMGGGIEPFQARIGADQARAVVVQSPFDFERNMRVFVAADVPCLRPGRPAAPTPPCRITSASARCASRADRSSSSPATTICAISRRPCRTGSPPPAGRFSCRGRICPAPN